MQIRRYEADSVQEAMARIKKELGPDAVVLSSKRLKGTGSGSFRVEVVAARDIQEEQVCVDIDGCRRSADGVKTEPFQRVQQDIQELKTLVRQIQKQDYAERYEAVDLAGSPDFAALAQVYGIRAMTISDNDEIDEAVQALLAGEKSFLLQCLVSPDEPAV